MIARGARVFEHSRVRALRAGADVVAETEGGSVRAGSAVLAVNAAARGVRAAAPPARGHLLAHRAHRAGARRRSSSSAGPAGESITDARTFVHYFRTTDDGRIVFGWGGGPARRRGAPARARRGRPRTWPAQTRRHLDELLPPSPGARSRTPGAARSTSPRATSRRSARSTGRAGAGPLRVRLHRQRRRPVAPRRTDPRRPRERRDPRGRPARPATPRPSRRSRSPGPAGWSCAPRSCARSASRGRGAAPDPLTRAVCAAPRALGIHVSR